MGASYNGSTVVSKTTCVGSIPTAPAISSFANLGHDSPALRKNLYYFLVAGLGKVSVGITDCSKIVRRV